MLQPGASVHTLKHPHPSISEACTHARPRTHTQCSLPSSRSKDDNIHTHTYTHPQRSSPSLLCQGAELSSTCLGITINSIAQAWLDPHPPKPSAQLGRAGGLETGELTVGAVHTPFSPFCHYPILSDVAGVEDSCPLKPIYAETFGMLLLSFLPR